MCMLHDIHPPSQHLGLGDKAEDVTFICTHLAETHNQRDLIVIELEEPGMIFRFLALVAQIAVFRNIIAFPFPAIFGRHLGVLDDERQPIHPVRDMLALPFKTGDAFLGRSIEPRATAGPDVQIAPHSALEKGLSHILV